MFRILLTLAILFNFSLFGQYTVPKSVLDHIQSIDSNKIKSHVAYLADDKLQGRLPGTAGFQMGVDYIVSQFKEFGLKPKGDKVSYLQRLMLRTTKLLKENTNVNITLANGTSKALVHGENFVLYPHPEKNVIDINAPLVFIGAGFNAPKFGLDDYKNINVKGKIVVILKKTPENVSENLKRHLMYAATYQAYAEKNGAIGVITCDFAQTPVRFKGTAIYMANTGLTVSVNSAGKMASSSQINGGKIQLYGNISVEALKEIMKTETDSFDSIWKKIEKGEFASMPMKSKLKAHYESDWYDTESYNVVGMVEGSDRKLKNEYVVHSGHTDHIGISKPVDGDSINNGAHDNASGIASALEIARTYASLPEKPKRSILFVLVTAEEMGLLGSGYFAKYPTVPKNKIVADINTDMPTIIAPLESVAPLGAEHSSMQQVVDQVASLLNLKSEPDPDPAEGRFVRSDQYNFLKAGIPAIHIKYGYKYSNPALNLAEKVRVFRENHYHKPSDELNDSFVWSAGRKYAQVNFLVSYIIAQTAQRPSFNATDFFNPNYNR